MTRRGLLIEDRHRLSLAYRWRDRCLTVALLGVWWHPADLIRHVIASEAFRWNVFVTDLGGVLAVTGAAVALTLGWGTYDRLYGGRSVPPGDADALLGPPRIGHGRRGRRRADVRASGAGSPRARGPAAAGVGLMPRSGGRARAVSRRVGLLLTGLVILLAPRAGFPQLPPGPDEMRAYTGLHRAAARGDAIEIRRLLAAGADPGVRDGHGRTPLHVAAFVAQAEAMRALVAGGADPNALDAQRYDVVTIAAVRDDVATLGLALVLGASPRTVTSPYDGTALIAAAHLGHVEVVRGLVDAASARPRQQPRLDGPPRGRDPR